MHHSCYQLWSSPWHRSPWRCRRGRLWKRSLCRCCANARCWAAGASDMHPGLPVHTAPIQTQGQQCCTLIYASLYGVLLCVTYLTKRPGSFLNVFRSAGKNQSVIVLDVLSNVSILWHVHWIICSAINHIFIRIKAWTVIIIIIIEMQTHLLAKGCRAEQTFPPCKSFCGLRSLCGPGVGTEPPGTEQGSRRGWWLTDCSFVPQEL